MSLCKVIHEMHAFNVTYIITFEIPRGITKSILKRYLRTTIFNTSSSAVHIELKQNGIII